MFTVPTSHTKTGAVLALAMFIATRVAQFSVTQITAPSIFAVTFFTDTCAVAAAVKVAQLFRTVIAAPFGFTGARLRVHVK